MLSTIIRMLCGSCVKHRSKILSFLAGVSVVWRSKYLSVSFCSSLKACLAWVVFGQCL